MVKAGPLAKPGARSSSHPREQHLEDFDLPWCWKLINSPSVKEVSFNHRSLFLTRTLANSDTFRAYQGFHLDNQIRHREEGILLVSLGSGADGHIGLAHGGITATIFDEGLGVLPLMTVSKDQSFMTATLNIAYKRPLPTPSVLLVRSWYEKIQGRKMYIKGTLEDGLGNVYATAEVLYITIKARI